jgi:hypothetical protein
MSKVRIYPVASAFRPRENEAMKYAMKCTHLNVGDFVRYTADDVLVERVDADKMLVKLPNVNDPFLFHVEVDGNVKDTGK